MPKNYKYLIFNGFCFFFLWVNISSFAQSNAISSPLDGYLKNANEYFKTDPAQSLIYAQKAESYALTNKDLPAQAQIYTLIGNIYGLHQNRADKAAEYHRLAFNIYNNLLTKKQLKEDVLYAFFLENITPVYQLISDENYNRKRRDKVAIRKYQALYTELSHFFLENEIRFTKNKTEKTSLEDKEKLSLSPKSDKNWTKNALEYNGLTDAQKELYESYINQLEQRLTQKGIDIKDIKSRFTQENNKIRNRVKQLNITILQKDSLSRQDSIIAQQKLKIVDAEKKVTETKYTLKTFEYRRNLLIFGIIGFFSILSTLVFYRNLKIVKNQKDQIEDQNHELEAQNEEIKNQKNQLEQTSTELAESYHKITDNINYARTVQQALLPRTEALQKVFRDHFVLFLPKDVVSGDFYWLHQTEENLFVAVVDCTGHGVSGGFMSMIGYMLLNKIIAENHTEDLVQVFQQLDTSIQEVLQQKTSNNTDGMAMALCKIANLNENTHHISFIGAKQSLLYCKQGKTELEELKGNRHFIGGEYGQQHIFNVQELTLNVGDTLYLTTDGLIDQGNPARKKFSRAKLENLLLEIQEQDLSAQKENIRQALQHHQKDADQRDDITFVGLKL